MPDQARPSFWTRTFILLSASQFLAYGHHAVLTPTLPLYLDHLGSTPFMVGLLLACFSATSVVIRPLVGTWVDSGGEIRVLSLSCIGLCLTVLIFVVPNVEGAFTANILRGFCWAGINTSGYAFLAAVVPNDRRGEASGYYSGIQSSASLFFPPAALWIIGLPEGGYVTVFALSSVVALLAAALAQVCGRGVRRTPPSLAPPPVPSPSQASAPGRDAARPPPRQFADLLPHLLRPRDSVHGPVAVLHEPALVGPQLLHRPLRPGGGHREPRLVFRRPLDWPASWAGRFSAGCLTGSAARRRWRRRTCWRSPASR